MPSLRVGIAVASWLKVGKFPLPLPRKKETLLWESKLWLLRNIQETLKSRIQEYQLSVYTLIFENWF